MKTLTNAHLIRIVDGTHGAFDRMLDGNQECRDLVRKFLNTDFTKTTVKELSLPDELHLPELEFAPVGEGAQSLGAM